MPRNYRPPAPSSRIGGAPGIGYGSVRVSGRAPGSEVQADVAQLVERNLAKVEVASSSLVVRSERVSSPSSGGLAERRGNGLQIRVHGFKSRTHLDSNTRPRAIGAAVARFLDTEEVTGSNPVSPTSMKWLLICINAVSCDLADAACRRLVGRARARLARRVEVRRGGLHGRPRA